jgi:hypothetical protein
VIQQRSILDSDEPSHEPKSPIARLLTSESTPATGLWPPFDGWMRYEGVAHEPPVFAMIMPALTYDQIKLEACHFNLFTEQSLSASVPVDCTLPHRGTANLCCRAAPNSVDQIDGREADCFPRRNRFRNGEGPFSCLPGKRRLPLVREP